MPITQKNPIGTSNKPEVIQENLRQLFESGHLHTGRTTAPTISEGAVWDIIPVELAGAAYLYIKFPSLGWKSILLT